jgi:polysaccharide export outer membrane protein
VLHACVFVSVSALLASCGAPQATPAPPPGIQDDTSLGPGDVFDVRIYGEEALSSSYRVSQDGTILFPLVGRVEVAGLQPPDVAQLLASHLRDGQILNDPQVSVFVTEYNSKRFSVVGEVQEPGNFDMVTGLTVVQAIGMAGGFTAMADENRTTVTRRIDGQLRRFRIPVREVTRGNSDDFPLQAGDIIYIPQRVF